MIEKWKLSYKSALTTNSILKHIKIPSLDLLAHRQFAHMIIFLIYFNLIQILFIRKRKKNVYTINKGN